MKSVVSLGGTALVCALSVGGCASDNVVGAIPGARAGAGRAFDAFGGQGADGNASARSAGQGSGARLGSSGRNPANAPSTTGSGGSTATVGASAAVDVTPAEPAHGGSAPTASGDSDAVGGEPADGTAGSDVPLATGGNTVVDGASDCIVRVATRGSDANDGSTWSLAFRTVQGGLTAASALLEQAGCPAVELWVASGTYSPTAGTDRTASFQLVSNVSLYGGFGGSERARVERNISGNQTVLSGEIGAPDSVTDNSYHVVRGVSGATLDGFTIRAGYADDFGDLVGAGMYNVAASPTIANCIFTQNTAAAGAGMYNDGSSPVISNCTFADNQVEIGEGGGMYNKNSSPTISNSAFTQNGAQSNGGGMYNVSSAPTITNSSFTQNTSRTGGGMENIDSSPTITNCTFSDNTAVTGAGMDNSESSPTVTNSTFSGNSGYVGAGMENHDSAPVLRNDTFVDNSVAGTAMFTGDAASAGGGMYNDGSTPSLTNCVFAGNRAGYAGAGMFNTNSSPVMTNCTFAGNAAGVSGGGIQDESGSSPALANVILWGDTAAAEVSELIDADAAAAATVSHSIVQGGDASGTNVITTDPLFVDAASGDLRLLPASPAIDAGDGCATFVHPTDRAGNERWDISAAPNSVDGVDIGAFEYPGTAGLDTRLAPNDCL